MYKCSITACDEKNVFIGHIYEMGDTIEEAKDKASTRCQKLCEEQPVAYASVTVTDNDGNYVDSDEFTLRNGELDLSGEGNPRVGISIVELWEYLKGKKTADGAEIVVTPNQPDYWDGSWPAPDDFATGEAYFDLKKAGELLCCDGEECVCYFDPEKDMANTTRTEKVLATICFACCKKNFSGLPGTLTRQNRHPALGGKVDLNGACSGCPVAEIRGDGAPISAGQKDKFFGNLVPGTECDQNLTSEKTWLPCEACGHATVSEEGGDQVVSLNDLEFCCLHCPVKEIRDCLEEAD